mmetsp:Transcript_74503/g.155308  ORF Transcript_74503/g.155308 Transcript_74503/m.155308 type:complete len:219 (+) Transcript_74503:28-684(+)
MFPLTRSAAACPSLSSACWKSWKALSAASKASSIRSSLARMRAKRCWAAACPGRDSKASYSVRTSATSLWASRFSLTFIASLAESRLEPAAPLASLAARKAARASPAKLFASSDRFWVELARARRWRARPCETMLLDLFATCRALSASTLASVYRSCSRRSSADTSQGGLSGSVFWKTAALSMSNPHPERAIFKNASFGGVPTYCPTSLPASLLCVCV